MAILLTGQYNNKKGKTYIIYIHDENLGSDSSDQFQVTKRLSWRWTGETKNIFQSVKGLTMNLGINVPASGAVRTFVNSFVTETNEHRYWLRVVREGSELFRGWLLVGQSEIPIRSQDDYPFTLSATDTLSLLNNYDYIDPATPSTPYEGADSVKDHLIKVLLSADLGDLYGASDAFLSTSVEYHNSLMPNTTDDYSTHFKIDHRKFGALIEEEVADVPFLEPTVVGERVVEPGEAGDVLKRLCFLFNAVFFHCNGQYYFISRSQILDAPSIPIFTYDKSGTQLSTGTVSSALTVGSPITNQTGYYVIKNSGSYTYQPPVKRIQIQHFLGGGNNKIIGHDWDIDYNDEKCFDDINNAGNAVLKASLPINITIKWIGHTNTTLFRVVMGLKIKIGTQYLIRDILTGLDVYDGVELPPAATHPDEIYEDATWSATSGYFKFVIDVGATDIRFFFNEFPHLQVYDIESPDIPESGQLCIDWDLVEIRKANLTGTWKTVSFSDADTFTVDGDEFDIYWSVKDSYINIESDGSQLNEDTLAYKQVRANVNLKNSEVLQYTTEIGDDPESNTHGRIQIYNGSEDEDADGGWSFNGSGTTYDSHKEILVYDMARLRSGVVRVMRSTITSDNDVIRPYSRITFDGFPHMIGSVSSDSDSEDCQGEFYTLDDSNSGSIVLDTNVYKSVGDNGSANTATGGGTSGGYEPPPEYILQINGDGTDRITVPDDRPLPSTDTAGQEQMNRIFKKALKGSGNMIYRTTRSHPTHFSVDNSTNEIILFRNSKTTDEFFFHWTGDTF